jgi:glycerol-1-phosphate dehydrogenase [NAD(P)+]
MEHTVSHLIDMANSSRGRGNAHHGAQVGVATVLVAIVWRRMRALVNSGALAELSLPSAADAEHRVRAAFDWMDPDESTATECWTDYSTKLEHLRETDAAERIRTVTAEWSAHDAVLDGLLGSPENIVAALRAAGAPTRFSELTNPADAHDVVWALTNCSLMRNRFTVADLAFLTGNWTEETVQSVLAEAEDLGAGL